MEPYSKKSLYVMAAATFLAFMGIGVVDPLLPIIAKQIGARHWEVEMLFTAYIFTMAFMMLPAGIAANRFGEKPVLTSGLFVVCLASLFCALAHSIVELSWFRAAWGLGNAMFFACAMTIMIRFSRSVTEAIGLFEAAVGLGMAVGPLLGGVLGEASWRYPFAATSLLAALACLCVWRFVKPPVQEKKSAATSHGSKDLLVLLRYRPFLRVALVSMLYYYAFFTVLAYSPLFLQLSAMELGWVFFGWGMMLAAGSAKLSHMLERKFSSVQIISGALLLFALSVSGIYFSQDKALQLALIIASGLFCGVSNSLFTTYTMELSPYPRNITSSAYNFVRWLGAGLAPVTAGIMAENITPAAPYLAAFLVLAIGIVSLDRSPKAVLPEWAEKIAN
ncbi:MFS transporter [Azotosporobacter soli]|uniref:MFS transporter n=1 Tax=Azotosporobacter soli TaxID=3055040 RepID=UPI0031FE4AA3